MTRKSWIFLLTGCLIAVLAHFRWFTDFSVLAHGDWLVQLSESSAHLLAPPFFWADVGLGYANINAPFYVLHVMHGLFATAGLSFGVIERLLYLWPITILSYVSVFLLIRRLTKSDAGAFVGAFIYSFNVYFLLIQQQHIYIMMADSLAPLVVLAFINAVDRGRAHDVVLAGLALFAVSACDFRIFYILSLVLPFYVLLDIMIARKTSRRELGKAMIVAISPFVLAVLLNAYWIIGFASTTMLTNNEMLNRPLFSTGAVGMAESINLYSGGWTGGKPDWFGSHPIPVWYWGLPAVAFAGFFVARRNRYAVFLLLVAAVGIFFGKMTNAPFGGIYEWLYEHFPGFNAFREPSKFRLLVIMGYSGLISFFTGWMWSQDWKVRWIRMGRWLLVGGLLAVCAWNVKPLISGEVGMLFSPKYMPDAHVKFNHILNDDSEYYRVLWIPKGSSWSLAVHHPRVSVGKLKKFIGANGTFAASASVGGTDERQAIDMVLSEHGNALLDYLSFKYIAFPLPYDWGGDVFGAYYLDRATVKGWLTDAPFLRRHDGELQELTVFENDGYRPLIYTTYEREDGPESLSDSVYPVQYSEISPTEYRIDLQDIGTVAYLNFGEGYHPDWVIQSAAPSWFGRLFATHQQPEGVSHRSSWADTNVFEINPELFCATDGRCARNESGGYDAVLTLYFAPQKFFYWGTLVSGTSLTVCLAYLAFDHRRNRRRVKPV